MAGTIIECDMRRENIEERVCKHVLVKNSVAYEWL